MKQRISLIVVLALALLVAAACGGGGDGPTNGAGTLPDSTTPGAADANGNANADANGNDNSGGTDDPTPDDNANDNNLDQTQDPTQGEDDKGEAIGSADEGLDALGGGFEWQREGGIAGFCDVVTVLAGTATVASCASEPPRIVAEVTLTAAQSRQVMTWIEDLRTFEREQSDGAVADSMSTRLIFEGEGSAEPTDEILADIEALVSEILAGASSP